MSLPLQWLNQVNRVTILERPTVRMVPRSSYDSHPLLNSPKTPLNSQLIMRRVIFQLDETFYWIDCAAASRAELPTPAPNWSLGESFFFPLTGVHGALCFNFRGCKTLAMHINECARDVNALLRCLGEGPPPVPDLCFIAALSLLA